MHEVKWANPAISGAPYNHIMRVQPGHVVGSNQLNKCHTKKQSLTHLLLLFLRSAIQFVTQLLVLHPSMSDSKYIEWKWDDVLHDVWLLRDAAAAASCDFSGATR